jgi:sphinganine-1-phosphate aldolase
MVTDVKVSLVTALIVLIFLHGPRILRNYRYYGLIKPIKKILFKLSLNFPSVRK